MLLDDLRSDEGGIVGHSCVKLEEAIALAAPPLSRSTKKAWLEYSPIIMLNLTESSPMKLGECSGCGEEGHELRECIAFEMLELW